MIVWVAFLVAIGCAYVGLQVHKSSRLPPNPPGLPILGNVLQVPSKLLFLKLHEWSKQLGDVYSLNLAGQKIIVLTTAKAAADVLDRLSTYTSGRPTFVMAGDIMSHNMLIPFMQYGESLRRTRRVVFDGFNTKAVHAYFPVLEDEALGALQRLMKDSSAPEGPLLHAAGSAMWRALYGGPTISSKEEKDVEKIDVFAGQLTSATSPMAFLVDIFPFMRYLPTWAAAWKKYGIEFYDRNTSHFLELLDMGRSTKSADDGSTGFIASCTESCVKFGVTDDEAAWMIGSVFSAGTETTATAMRSFILAMALHPEVVRRAQAEIDAVVIDRPPTFADYNKLPYVRAVVKETLRWRPPAPAGVPHVATETFAYQKYVIPKGAMIIGNVWSINRDPAFFPDYDAFRPERFLDANGQLKDPLPDYHDDFCAFGFGRRVCPGSVFATNALFIQSACLLWAFHFGKPEGEGANVGLSTAFVDSGATVHPAQFSCSLTPRSPRLAETIASARQDKS